MFCPKKTFLLNFGSVTICNLQILFSIQLGRLRCHLVVDMSTKSLLSPMNFFFSFVHQSATSIIMTLS